MSRCDEAPDRQHDLAWEQLGPTGVDRATTRPPEAAAPHEAARRAPASRHSRITALAIVAASVIGLGIAGPPWAGPPRAADGAAAPLSGNVRLSSGGVTAPLVLVYGSATGLEIVRAPVVGRPGVIPISSEDRELRVISLGLAPLRIQADIGGPHGIQSFGATGRVITVVQTTRAPGVRTGL